MTFLTPVYQIALIAALTGSAIGFAVGVWWSKRQLETRIDSLMDFGGDVEEDDVVMDLSSAVEEMSEDDKDE